MPIHLTILSASQPKKGEAEPGTSLLQALQKNRLTVDAPCGGHGRCRKCLVEIAEDNGENPVFHQVLACQHPLTTNLLVRLPVPDKVRIQSESYFPKLQISYDQHPHGSYGLSVDIGTTTVVVFLENLSEHIHTDHFSFLNPQKTFGADVISRIQYAYENSTHLTDLQSLLITELNTAIDTLLSDNKLPVGQICMMTVTGNTPMLHIFSGTDPSSMAAYPFDPAFTSEKTMPASSLGLQLLPNTPVVLLPSLSAFVGADIMGGIAATEMTEEKEYALFLDIGTNGEMAIGNAERLICCATAAGPAFEGARISCGQGGVDGAIHRFDEHGFQTIGDQPPTGLCGSGLIDVMYWLRITGQIPADGYLDKALPVLPEFGLSITPQDVREVQLAKGAIMAGILTLIQKAGIHIDQVSRVFLAGGFGFAIHPPAAIGIGLLPKEFHHKIIRAGNTAGLGARLYLHSESFRKRVQDISVRAEHFDLSADPYFADQFVMQMHFPDTAGHSDLQNNSSDL